MIKFDFKVNAHIATYVNILDFGPAPSGRDPAFWINPSRQLNPAFNINGANFGFNVPVTINEGQYYSVEIAQFLVFKKVVNSLKIYNYNLVFLIQSLVCAASKDGQQSLLHWC